MTNRFRKLLRRIVDALLRTQRYRILRAHLWDDAVREMHCGHCT